MKTVTRRLRIATSPMVLAVALGLLGSNVLGDEEDETTLSDPAGAEGHDTPSTDEQADPA